MKTHPVTDTIKNTLLLPWPQFRPQLRLLRMAGMALMTATAAFAASIYIAPSGNDTSGNGSLSTPYNSLSKAATVAQPGDTVYARGGTYTVSNQQNLGCAGTSGAVITFQPYQSELPIFDGSGQALGKMVSFISTANYVVFQGFEFRNSSGKGIAVTDGQHITIRNCKVHDTSGRGIGGSGDYITIEGNEVYSCVLENINGQKGSGGWAQGIGSWPKASGAASTNWIVRNNVIHNNWGEGCIAGLADTYLIEGNIIYDNWNTEIYVDNGKNVTIRNNYCYTTDSLGRYVTGLKMGCENNSYAFLQANENITVSNNVFVNVNKGINWWNDGNNTSINNTYKNVKIWYNIVSGVHDATRASIDFPAVLSGRTPPSGCEIRNNIVYKSGYGTSLNLGNASAWSVSNNDWPDGVPAQDTSAGSFAANPLLVNGVWSAGANGFMLQATSPCRDAGVAVTVTTDFWGTNRDSTPCIGIHEYSTGSSPTNAVATADTYALKSSATTNYGTAATINAKQSSSPNERIAFVKFDLSSLGFNPTTATLVVTTDATTEAGTVRVNQCTTDGWVETTLNWNNKPAVGTSIATAAVTSGTVADKTFDVTSYVRSQYTSDPTKIVSFAITSDSGQIIMKSRETGSADAPTLVLIP